MKAVIIEDEPLVAKDLRNLIAAVAPEMEILSVLDSLSAAREWFSEREEPDVLFCDIQLSDGASFELFKSAEVPPVVSERCPVIFTTAYDEYALRAFKLNSVDYLLKPVDKKELAAALEKLERRLSASGTDETLEARMRSLLNDLTQREGGVRYKERFLAHSKGMTVLVDTHNVAYFLKDELIYLVAMDGKRFVTDYQTLEEIEEIANPKDFFRANRQTIVHIRAVEGFKTEYTGKLNVRLKMPAGGMFDVSREKASLFKKWLE